jgi:hypothetical protein
VIQFSVYNAGRSQVAASSLRGAKGFGTFNTMMTNHENRIMAQQRRYIKRAAYYLRKVARSKIKRGRTKVQKFENQRTFNTDTGKFNNVTMKTKWRTRSTPPNSPLHHAGSKMGLKSLWAEKYKGSPDAWIIAPLTFKSAGAKKVNFKIHRKLAKGGGGLVYMPVNDNIGISKKQMFTQGLSKTEWRWVPSRYPPRPYMSNAIPDTRKKFKTLWYASKER